MAMRDHSRARREHRSMIHTYTERDDVKTSSDRRMARRSTMSKQNPALSRCTRVVASLKKSSAA